MSRNNQPVEIMSTWLLQRLAHTGEHCAWLTPCAWRPRRGVRARTRSAPERLSVPNRSHPVQARDSRPLYTSESKLRDGALRRAGLILHTCECLPSGPAARIYVFILVRMTSVPICDVRHTHRMNTKQTSTNTLRIPPGWRFREILCFAYLYRCMKQCDRNQSYEMQTRRHKNAHHKEKHDEDHTHDNV